MTDRIIMVKYSCPSCGVLDADTPVPARIEGQDVLAWMDQTIRELGRDHAVRSPTCHPRQLHDLKIPIDGAEVIGGPDLRDTAAAE